MKRIASLITAAVLVPAADARPATKRAFVPRGPLSVRGGATAIGPIDDKLLANVFTGLALTEGVGLALAPETVIQVAYGLEKGSKTSDFFLFACEGTGYLALSAGVMMYLLLYKGTSVATAIGRFAVTNTIYLLKILATKSPRKYGIEGKLTATWCSFFLVSSYVALVIPNHAWTDKILKTLVWANIANGAVGGLATDAYSKVRNPNNQ